MLMKCYSEIRWRLRYLKDCFENCGSCLKVLVYGFNWKKKAETIISLISQISENISIGEFIPCMSKVMNTQVETTAFNYWKKLYNKYFAHDDEISATFVSVIVE